MDVNGLIRLDALSKLDVAALPTEFRLFAFGDNATSKGTFKLDTDGAAAVMAAYTEQGVELAIDYEHQSLAAASNGKPAPAAGWFKPEVRTDGLYATNVRWTERAAEMLRSREYRYFSPTFATDKANRITRLLPAALTNIPASKKQTALVAASQTAPTVTETTNMPNFNSIVGLKDDASEEEVSARVASLASTAGRLLELTGKANEGDALGEVISLKDKASRLDAAERELAEWQESAANAERTKKTADIQALVSNAVASKRYGLPKDEFVRVLTSHGEAHGVESLKTLIGSYPERLRQYQAPPPVNADDMKKRAVEEYQKAHPGVSFGDAYIACSQANPSLFSQEGR